MVLISVLLLTLSQLPAGTDASKLSLAAPMTAAVVDMDKIGGEPWRLCWSPDAQHLYLGAKRGRTATDMTHHVIDIASGTVRKVEAEPDWAAKYWTWKSWKTAPGNQAFAIALDEERKNVTATARPMGGALARGGGTDPTATGVSIDDAATQSSQNVQIITMRLKGEVIGRWENPPIDPGLTFGWGPAGSNTIAFASQDGRLVLMDDTGRKQRIDTTKDARLPAWSEDGRHLAWAEKQDRKKFRIQVAGVSGS